MSQVLVVQLRDDASIAEAARAIAVALGVIGARDTCLHVAIREDADKVLSVFERSPSGPEETP